MVLSIIGILLLLIALFLFYKTINIKLEKATQQQTYQQNLKHDIKDLENEKSLLEATLNQRKDQLNQDLIKFKKTREEQLNTELQHEKASIQNFIEKEYEKARKEIQKVQNATKQARESASQQYEQLQGELDKIKSSLHAGIEARKRQQQEKEKINFYKLQINDNDLEDVKKLENLKLSLHNPVILSKLIWTQYFQKQTTELCNRVLGTDKISGIYKITNIITNQCYIGQSVDISQRWKDHIKCGLGIDAPATNKLYKNMQEYKIWNFTFELLEPCEKSMLNEKEAFWINTYESNNYGLNTTAGNKK